jgi:15-cis-phytoene desaturase
MRKKVVVLGGGVAGLSAAHELMERGFAVTVYECKSIPGGKARSMPVPNSGKQGRLDLPGEHGFRFFPKFYKHITDTMKRIPYGTNENGVYDNLVEGSELGMAFFDQPMIPFLTEFPKSITDWKTLLKSLFDNHLGLSEQDVEHYVSRLWQVITSCDERRLLDYQRIAWWDFIEGDKQSEAFRRVFAGLTRILVAAKSREANTCTIGTVGATLMLDMAMPGSSADRLLCGPTNDVWINPWLDYLQANGVEYHLQAKVDYIHCTNGQIQGAAITENGRTFLATADYFIAALPVEVMAGLLNEDILKADPTLASIQTLSQSVDWMNGIQFYLNEDVTIIHGHVILMDSPWALTAVSQAQFWPEVMLSDYGDGQVKGIISVDISDWQTPGILYGKPAMKCSAEEIKTEVWEQLKRSVNGQGRAELKDEQLVNWFLDSDIQFPNPSECVNLEPLLVNKINTWYLRPNAYTAIPNLFLASDYVRTNTDLATMESANEAARRAVNAILEASGSEEDLCEIWEMYNFKLLAAWRKKDHSRFQQGLPWDEKIVG